MPLTKHTFPRCGTVINPFAERALLYKKKCGTKAADSRLDIKNMMTVITVRTIAALMQAENATRRTQPALFWLSHDLYTRIAMMTGGWWMR